VLHLLPAFAGGGVEHYVKDLTNTLAALEPSIESFIASAGGTLEASLQGPLHITLPLQSRSPWGILKAAKLIQTLARQKGITHIHAHSRGPAWAGYLATRALRLPFITTFHGVYNASNMFKKFYNSVMARGHKVVAISHFIARHIEKTYPWAAGRVETLWEGIDTNLFNPSAVEAHTVSAFRAELGLTSTRKLIVLVGRLTRWKGQHILLQAAQHLDPQRCALLFVGSNQGRADYKTELERLAKNLTLPVFFRESYAPLQTVYASADVVVSCSTDPEAFGRVIAEAIAMGRPFVGTHHGGAVELTHNGRFGTLIPPANPLALARAIEAATPTTSPEAMFAHIHTHYNLDTMARAMAHMYAGFYGR
jgi:glycosyltransferase involved in cell wall biosynthesis